MIKFCMKEVEGWMKMAIENGRDLVQKLLGSTTLALRLASMAKPRARKYGARRFVGGYKAACFCPSDHPHLSELCLSVSMPCALVTSRAERSSCFGVSIGQLGHWR